MKQNQDQVISRRQFLKYSTLFSAVIGTPLFFYGCAVDPVTGRKQINLVSKQQEIGIDKQQSPHQFSADYGIVQDKGLNLYVSEVGNGLTRHVHRPDMPYNFNCVNANYINAYAFPGGTIAVSRGILLSLENEAQLAALIGHELGHVNARHSAEQMSKGQLSSILVGGLAAVASTQGSALGELTQQLGMIGQGLLLSKYSRDNEREADALGHEYMVKTGYPSNGFVGLMQMLNDMHGQKATSTAVLFSTHPMSSERLNSAKARNAGIYAASNDHALKRERYMDRIAGLRAKRKGIELLQTGEKHMAKKEYDKSKQAFAQALKIVPDDYTGHLLMAKNYLVQKKAKSALLHTGEATKIYPSEAQGYYLSGFAHSSLEQYAQAYNDFKKYDELLPGNPQITFYKGYCQDKKGENNPAANSYIQYLKMINYQSNKYSQYAYARLKEWGYAK